MLRTLFLALVAVLSLTATAPAAETKNLAEVELARMQADGTFDKDLAAAKTEKKAAITEVYTKTLVQGDACDRVLLDPATKANAEAKQARMGDALSAVKDLEISEKKRAALEQYYFYKVVEAAELLGVIAATEKECSIATLELRQAHSRRAHAEKWLQTLETLAQ